MCIIHYRCDSKIINDTTISFLVKYIVLQRSLTILYYTDFYYLLYIKLSFVIMNDIHCQVVLFSNILNALYVYEEHIRFLKSKLSCLNS